MRGYEVRLNAESFLGRSIDELTAMNIINEAIALIGDKNLLYGHVTLEAEANKWYFMPKNMTHLTSVEDANGNKVDYWEERGQEIRFPKAGTYKISARKTPYPIDKLEDMLDVHPSYFGAIVNYLRSFVAGDTNQEVFRHDVAEVFSSIRRGSQPRTVKVIRHG